METRLRFTITTVDGEKVEQTISVPPTGDPNIPMEAVVMEAINRMMAQYAQVGMMRKEGGKYTLLTASQIKTVEVEEPSILIAGPQDAARAVGGAKLVQMP